MRKFVIGCCVLVGILGITYAFLPYYAQNALVNLFPGIDDYHIFDNRTVRAARLILGAFHKIICSLLCCRMREIA